MTVLEAKNLELDLTRAVPTAAPQTAKKFDDHGKGRRYVRTIPMSPHAWNLVPDNPRQRDTIKRAPTANHLHKPDPSHVKVSMALILDPDYEAEDRRMKIDGHTRNWLWANGLAPAPDILYVEVWECDTKEDAIEAYTKCDNRAATEHIVDEVYGSLNELDIKFQSEVLKTLRFSAAMRYATNVLLGSKISQKEMNTHKFIQLWKNELYLLDSVMPTSRKFNASIMCAALLLFRRYGKECHSFWLEYAQNKGSKIGNESDAVQAYTSVMENMRGEQARGNWRGATLALGYAIMAYQAYRKKQTYTSVIKVCHENTFNNWVKDLRSREKDSISRRR
jgi:hypothetical protein